MRAIVTLDMDTAAAVEHLQRQRGIGMSVAVNELVRAGLAARPDIQPFVQRAVGASSRAAAEGSAQPRPGPPGRSGRDTGQI